MDKDNLLMGINFDSNMFGKEEKPLIVLIDLVEHLIQNKLDLSFVKFESLQEIKSKYQS
jgi:hypothetical protein